MASQGSGDEKSDSKGSELPQLDGTSAPSEPADGVQPKFPFIPSEPLREDQVQNAVKFLSHPKVKGSAVIYRRSFLERKGLTKEEIDEAFRHVPDPPPADTVAISPDTQPRALTSSPPQVSGQFSRPADAPIGAVSLAPASRHRFSWSHALIAVGVLSASGAGSALFFKKMVLPRLKSWIRKVAMEDDISVEEDTSSRSLAEETAEAAKAAASAAAIIAAASQELLNSKNEDRKYFEAFMGLIDVQVKEMKSIGESIHKLEKARERDKLIDEYVQYATPNGTGRDSRVVSQINQTETVLNQGKVNGTPNSNYGSGGQSLTPPSLESSHPKSYMEIMAMVERGEKPPNIREVNDAPPNPNQPPSKPLVAPRTKPWEISQPIENGQPRDEPWWRKKSVTITELEPDRDDPKQPHIGSAERQSVHRAWVPPQPPSVAMPEAAAAIRHPKTSPLIQEAHSDDDERKSSSHETDEIVSRTPNFERDAAPSSSSAGPQLSEIEEHRDVEVVI